MRWTGEPIDQQIPFVVMSQPTQVARRPAHYYIPAAWYPIAEMLQRQGIEVQRLEQAQTVEAEVALLTHAELNASARPFEGRTLFTPGEIERERREVLLPAGSFRVSTAQPLGTLAVLMLEPECSASLFQWGYFSEVLQRTEYFEGYVMEPLARAMLDADPELPGVRAEAARRPGVCRQRAGTPGVVLRQDAVLRRRAPGLPGRAQRRLDLT